MVWLAIPSASNMEEVKARGGRIIAVVTEGDEQVREIAGQVIEVPQTLNFLAPLLSVIYTQKSNDVLIFQMTLKSLVDAIG